VSRKERTESAQLPKRAYTRKARKSVWYVFCPELGDVLDSAIQEKAPMLTAGKFQ
jgi:hypothetical protein